MHTQHKKWERIDMSFIDEWGDPYETTLYDKSLTEAYQHAIEWGFVPDPWYMFWSNHCVYVACTGREVDSDVGTVLKLLGQTQVLPENVCVEYELFDQDTFERIV